jgi:hypothetical protein
MKGELVRHLRSSLWTMQLEGTKLKDVIEIISKGAYSMKLGMEDWWLKMIILHC